MAEEVMEKGRELFPEVLVNELFDKVKGHSSLASLTNSTPVAFNGNREFTFAMDKEVDIVAEGGAYSNGGLTLKPVTIVPLKMEYGARVSKEFLYATEEVRIEILKKFSEGFAKKLARGIDIAAIHGVNPRSGQEASIIGNNCFVKAVTQKVEGSAGTADEKVEAAIALVDGEDNDVNGMCASKKFRADLSKLTTTGGAKMFPDLAWGNVPGTINGLTTSFNSTVGFKGSKVDAVLGDFGTAFQWGFAKEIPLEIVKYGNPDNDLSLGDLSGHGQVYLRCEVYVGWGILDPNSFAIIGAE